MQLISVQAFFLYSCRRFCFSADIMACAFTATRWHCDMLLWGFLGRGMEMMMGCTANGALRFSNPTPSRLAGYMAATPIIWLPPHVATRPHTCRLPSTHHYTLPATTAYHIPPPPSLDCRGCDILPAWDHI